MFEQFLWLPFLIAITLLTLSPGVDTLLVLRNATRGGVRDGWLTSLGICLGLFGHALVSAAGLSVILLGSAELFWLLKLAGACYLVWLGIQSLRSAWLRRGLSVPLQSSQTRVSGLQSLREGLLSNLLNPKPIVFYMAFLPQFIDPGYPAIPQALMMAAIHFLIGMLWQGGLAMMVGKAAQWLQRPRVSRALDTLCGSLLLLFGARLLLIDR